MERETTNTLLPDRQRSYNRWLALLLVLFLITTIIFAALYGVEKGKAKTTTTMGSSTTITPVPPTSSSTAVPPTSSSTPGPPTSSSSPGPMTSSSTPGPPTSSSTPGPTTSSSTPGPTTSSSTPVPTTSSSTPVPTTSSSTPVPTTLSPDGPICVSPYCIKAADYLLNSIDETINPCEDFYHFACGTWLKNARIPEDSGVQNIFNLLGTELNLDIIDLLSTPNNGTVEPNAVTNARTLYNSCINEAQIEAEGVEAVLDVVNNQLRGWPILLGSEWNASTYDLSQLLLSLHQYDDGMMFSVLTNTNQENSSAYDIELGQGTLGLQETAYYQNETAITAAYRQFMRDLAMALSNGTEIKETDIEDMYTFERDIAQYHWSAAEQSLRDNETIRTTFGNLSTSLPPTSTFNFTDYVRQIYRSVEIHLEENDVILVSEVAYLVNVSDIMQKYPPRVVQNYLVWRFLMNRAGSMPRQIRSILEQFTRVFKGTTAEPSRATTCANYVNDAMGLAVSRLYVQKYFDENARNQSEEIITNIRQSMINLINNATWMDGDSKSRAILKEQAIVENIGYPDFIVGDNVTQLEEMYKAYLFNQSLIDNTLDLQRTIIRENLAKLRQSVDRRAWGVLPPTIINAFYDPSTNSISFPAGILQTPYFNKDAPKYLNYGGIGMVIGHEITHGFDDMGRQYDKEGDRIPWWSNETIANFNVKKQCIIDQYSNYTVEQIQMKLNGDQTQGENIADNGGIKSSFYAYQRWAEQHPNVDFRLPGLSKYSQEQLFFMGFAHGWCAKFTDEYAINRVLTDVHSIPQFRVLGPLSNFAEFDRVFSCTPGQGDSRINKCAVW